MKQLVDLITSHKDLTGLSVPTRLSELPIEEILTVLHMDDPMEVNSPEYVEVHGPAAMFMLHQYRYTIRFVDDFTSAPNPFTKRLLYCFVPDKAIAEYSLMGGLIKGIYPGQFLELEATPGDSMYLFSTLDVQIETRKHSITTETGDVESVVQSFTKLYDKRRNACYRGIPIVQYTHVASTLSIHCGYNILIGQLHRFRELIMLRDNYILEVARLVRRMQNRGYRKSILFKKLQHHLRLYPDTYGDRSAHRLLNDIKHMYDFLCNVTDWEFIEPTREQLWAVDELREMEYALGLLSEGVSDIAE